MKIIIKIKKFFKETINLFKEADWDNQQIPLNMEDPNSIFYNNLIGQLNSEKNMRKPKFELFQSKLTREWYFNLIAQNGKVIATSEGYHSKQAAKRGIESVKKNAPKAAIIELN